MQLRLRCLSNGQMVQSLQEVSEARNFEEGRQLRWNSDWNTVTITVNLAAF
jgi:hypothetical protein